MSWRNWALAPASCLLCLASVRCADSHGDPILAPAASGVSDGGDDGSASQLRWCLRQAPTPTLCDDFDVPGETAALVAAGAATGVIDMTQSSSAPASLLLTAPALTGTAFAFYGVNFPYNPNLRAVHVQYDLRIELLGSSFIPYQLRFNSSMPSYLLQLYAQSGATYASTGPEGVADAGTFLILAASPRVGSWSHIQDDLTVNPPLRSITVDGASALQVPLDPAFANGPINLQLGIDWVEAGTAATVRVDNLLINIQ